MTRGAIPREKKRSEREIPRAPSKKKGGRTASRNFRRNRLESEDNGRAEPEVLLLAADSLKTKKKMWETIVTYTGNSFDNRKMLDMMVMGAKDYLAQTTPGDTWLDVSESDDGALSLKERK